MTANSKYNELLDLFLETLEHLEYCNWGDSWERECSEDLRKKVKKFLKKRDINHVTI